MIVIYDTETTGLPLPSRVPVERQPRIIEFAALLTDEDGVIVDRFESLFDPELTALDPKITKITGLTLTQLKGKPLFKEKVEELAEFFKRAHTVVGHNLDFDLTMFGNELRRLKMDPKDFPMPERFVCTIQQYEYLYGRWLKQGELYQHFMQKPQAKAHRAMDDIVALHECLIAANFFAGLKPPADGTGVLQ